MKKIAILGSTGSIGTQTLEVVAEHKDIEVVALACGRNIQMLESQMRQFQPKLVAVWNETDAVTLRNSTRDLSNTGLYGHGRITCSSNDSRSRNSCDCNCWNVRNTSDNCQQLKLEKILRLQIKRHWLRPDI